MRQVLGGQEVLPDDWASTGNVIRETGRRVLGMSSGKRKRRRRLGGGMRNFRILLKKFG